MSAGGIHRATAFTWVAVGPVRFAWGCIWRGLSELTDAQMSFKAVLAALYFQPLSMAVEQQLRQK